MPVAAVLAGVATAAVVGDAVTTREAWGASRLVAVSRRDLDVGTRLAPDDIEWAPRPAVMIPAGALVADDRSPEDGGSGAADGAPTVGRLVVAPLLRGEIVAESRLAPGGVRGLAAQVPAHRVALAIPSDVRTPPLEAAQAVDLYAADTADSSAPPGAPRLARRAPVLQVGEHQVTVAVTEQEAPAVAQALVGSTVIVALTAP